LNADIPLSSQGNKYAFDNKMHLIVSISSYFPCNLLHESLDSLFQNDLTLSHIEGIILLSGHKASVWNFEQICFLQVLGKKILSLSKTAECPVLSCYSTGNKLFFYVCFDVEIKGSLNTISLY